MAAANLMMIYRRDYKRDHWCRREAQILIRQREQLGLPYIDRNYIDPRKLPLPSEEELEGIKITI